MSKIDRRGVATIVSLDGAGVSAWIGRLAAPWINPPLAGRFRQFVATDACRRLLGCQAGATAAEFGLLAVPFFALVFLILNTALAFFAQQTLQTATTQAARLIMTGQAQAQKLGAAQFQQAICANSASLLDCAGIYVNVRTFSSFSTVSMLNPVQNGKFSSSNMGYSPGVSGDIVLVQAFYQWPLYATSLGFDFSNVSGGRDLLVATAAFRNEPF